MSKEVVVKAHQYKGKRYNSGSNFANAKHKEWCSDPVRNYAGVKPSEKKSETE